MSLIQRIRDKAAWLIIGAIALAMIGFIVTDAFQQRGRSNSGKTTYGKVDGEKIDYVEFQKRVKTQEDQYAAAGYPMSDALHQSVQNSLWEQTVEEIVLDKQYSKLGIEISDKEIGDLLYGPNPPEELKRQFVSPETGQYDAMAAHNAIRGLKKGSVQYNSFWGEFVPALKKNRQREKYTSLLANSVYVPKWMVEKFNSDNSLIASMSYVLTPYTSIPDSSVKVTDEDINAFTATRKDQYKQENSRGIAYVLFSYAPSAEDSAEVIQKLNNLKSEFSSTEDITGFLARSASEIPYYNAFLGKSRLQLPNIDSIVKTPVGGIYGPYLDQNNYVLARIVGQRQMPDTVKVRHILIATQQQNPQTGQAMRLRDDSTAKKIVDSVQDAIRKGTSFDTLLLKYSDDPGSKDKGGVYDSIPSGKMVPEFNDFIFTNPPGSKGIVKTDFGYHYIEVLNHKGNDPGYKIAYLALPIIASQATESNANGQASQFAGESRTAKKFDENVTRLGLQKYFADNVRPADASIPNIGSNRSFVKWINEADLGDVSEPIAVEDKYVVAVVTEINKEGVMTANKARPLVEVLVRNQKKAEQVIKKIGNASTLEAVAAATKQVVQKADSVEFGQAMIPNVGREFEVVGAAFNKQWQGKITPPIEGTQGVFVVKPEGISAKPNPASNIEQQRIMLGDQLKSMAPRAIESLKKSATVKDYRGEF